VVSNSSQALRQSVPGRQPTATTAEPHSSGTAQTAGSGAAERELGGEVLWDSSGPAELSAPLESYGNPDYHNVEESAEAENRDRGRVIFRMVSEELLDDR
jgi:hypothetical protein